MNKTIHLVPFFYLPDGQLTYKFVPLNNSDQIITTLNGSVNHHQNIITGNDGSEAKLSVLSALESIYLILIVFKL